ncbi:hypothetical protein DICPUDRAFT_99461 [Dictyostelium purpureum]|uniref:Transmembrane protein n=1 Tax=Dictyostelium purpureum TaxID=5786 RepID=F0ZZD4_DICPU|nr:uncharacterized protein DICPUDRAFT_99461 [Dictyostelium purpureum]EGC30680.1 hypothetical protein DICPUDRAFT_99461 [Dictyostelium purpureum]|eukprot:XP_003292778.1 hypothetical protein DICPUDRAFT_99461 [Dictyostelium purpureum]
MVRRKFKKDIFYKKEFEFNEFLINNKEIYYNKVDCLDGEQEYFREAFGFETPNLLSVLKAIRTFLSLGFIILCFLAILTILFMIDIQFIPKDNNPKTLRELKYWKFFFSFGPCLPTLFIFIAWACCFAIPKSIRIDCYNEFGEERCQQQLRYHSSFQGENDIWSWGPGRGWKTILVSTLVSLVSSIFSIYTSYKISLLE